MSYDLVCLSHLRWNFVYQRPQHLMSRFARERRVFFIEEPLPDDDGPARLDRTRDASGVEVVVPRLNSDLDDAQREQQLARLLDQLIDEERISDYALWYYTPMALGFSAHLTPRRLVYDCMDELSGFAFAPPLLKQREQELFRRAKVVFTGGYSLWEAKRGHHANVHPFPSSVDVRHFAQARSHQGEPQDQRAIPHPRIGFCGVIDERMDIELLHSVAELRPDWHFVMIGPVVKIDPATLPRFANIHYLGGRGYEELPAYMAGWDAAMMPFALNDATRYISPTKTPEYLAAGLPVVSTPIRDVVRPYGEKGLVHIASDAREFEAALESALAQKRSESWLARVDQHLAGLSWDRTWRDMTKLIDDCLAPARESSSSHAETEGVLHV